MIDDANDKTAGQDYFSQGDGELLTRVRAGDDAAFAELFSRHAGVARGFAMRYANDLAEAEDIAAEAFFRVLQAVRRGSGPDDNVRAYLATVIRRLAAEWRMRRRDVPVADEELSRRVDPDADQAGTRAEANLIARAFTSLPQRWRYVLWQVEVEGERPAVVAPRFGLSPNATAALARRAREGLRAAYLQAHAPSVCAGSACQAVIDKLGAYTAGLVRGSEAQRIVAHLAGCASCRKVHAELADVCAGLRRYAGALPIPVLAALPKPTVPVHAALPKPTVPVHAALPKPTVPVHAALPKPSVPAHAASGSVAGKSAALAGKAAAFGLRFKLAVAAASVVAVGGLGISAGPLLLHLTSTINADRGTVAQLPVLPGPQTIQSSARSYGPASESTGTDIQGPRAHQHQQRTRTSTSTAVSSSTGAPASTTVGGGSGSAGGQSDTQPAADHTGGSPSSDSVQDETTTNQRQPELSPNTANRNPVATTTETVTPTTAERHGSPQTTIWSTEYTTDGTTVTIIDTIVNNWQGDAPGGK